LDDFFILLFEADNLRASSGGKYFMRCKNEISLNVIRTDITLDCEVVKNQIRLVGDFYVFDY